MELISSISRLHQLTPENLGYRIRSLWMFCITSGHLAKWSRLAAGRLMCVAIFASPWMTGGIQPWSIYVLAAMLCCAGLCWIIWRWRDREGLSFAWWVIAALVAAIILTCIASIVHATNAWNPLERALVNPVHPDRWLPSTVHRRTSAYWLIQVGPVLFALLIMSDLAKSADWRRMFLASLAASGTLIAVYGCLQHAGLLPALAEQALFPRSVFASFNNHGNAGAWLNLALPAAIAMAAVNSGRSRVAWLVAAAIILTGALVNISKAASLFAIAIVTMAFIAALLRQPIHDRREFAVRGLRRVVLPIVALLVLAWMTGRLSSWSDMPKTVEAESGRRVMWGISRRIAEDSGAFGHGAGSFKLLLPTTAHFDPALYMRWAVTRYTPGLAINQWMYPCNDLLQAWIEWGPVGTLLGLLIPAGAAIGLLRILGRSSDREERAVAALSFVALGFVALHSMGDFPLQILSIQIAVSVYLAIGWAMLSKKRVDIVEPKSLA